MHCQFHHLARPHTMCSFGGILHDLTRFGTSPAACGWTKSAFRMSPDFPCTKSTISTCLNNRQKNIQCARFRAVYGTLGREQIVLIVLIKLIVSKNRIGLSRVTPRAGSCRVSHDVSIVLENWLSSQNSDYKHFKHYVLPFAPVLPVSKLMPASRPVSPVSPCLTSPKDCSCATQSYSPPST